jgi:hypothetical protein
MINLEEGEKVVGMSMLARGTDIEDGEEGDEAVINDETADDK